MLVTKQKAACAGVYPLFKKVMTHHMIVLERLHNTAMAGLPGTSEVCGQGQNDILGCLGIKGQLLHVHLHTYSPDQVKI